MTITSVANLSFVALLHCKTTEDGHGRYKHQSSVAPVNENASPALYKTAFVPNMQPHKITQQLIHSKTEQHITLLVQAL